MVCDDERPTKQRADLNMYAFRVFCAKLNRREVSHQIINYEIVDMAGDTTDHPFLDQLDISSNSLNQRIVHILIESHVHHPGQLSNCIPFQSSPMRFVRGCDGSGQFLQSSQRGSSFIV
jgi:hypothetical protein